jgi:hypothetical protein
VTEVTTKGKRKEKSVMRERLCVDLWWWNRDWIRAVKWRKNGRKGKVAKRELVRKGISKLHKDSDILMSFPLFSILK